MKQSLFVTIASLALLTTSLYDRQANAASDELDYFHGCVSQEIPAALQRSAMTYGTDFLRRDHADIDHSVFAICKQRSIDDSQRIDEPSYVHNTVEAVFKQMQKIAELQKQLQQQWRDDPEKALEDQAVRAYSMCLEGSARAHSRTSNDPPEVIEQASLDACAKNRQIVFDTFRSRTNSFGPEAMAALEKEFQRKLPQIIIKTRDDVRQAAHR
jgi:hypothetical protein